MKSRVKGTFFTVRNIANFINNYCSFSGNIICLCLFRICKVYLQFPKRSHPPSKLTISDCWQWLTLQSVLVKTVLLPSQPLISLKVEINQLFIHSYFSAQLVEVHFWNLLAVSEFSQLRYVMQSLAYYSIENLFWNHSKNKNKLWTLSEPGVCEGGGQT